MIPPAVRALFRNTPTIAPVPHRAVLSVTGSQAAEFLNGIVASAVPPAPECHFYTAFLHAQGRVLHDAFVYSHTTPQGKKGYLIEYDSRPSEAPAFLPMLKRYVLRSKVRLRDVSDEYEVWAAWGSEKERQWETPRRWQFARSGAIEPDWEEESAWPWGTEPGTVRDRRSVGMGHRILVRKSNRPAESATHDVAGPEDYTLHRILHGVPEGIDDIIPTHSFPMDCNLDVMGALDFRKGCYVGQELTVRTYHTGILRKRVWPVLISQVNTSLHRDSSDARLPTFPPHLDIRPRIPKTAEEGPVKVRPRGSGKLLSSVGNVGLALLRVQQAKMAQNGEVSLEFEVQAGERLAATTWSVKHWRPEGMPEIPDETEM